LIWIQRAARRPLAFLDIDGLDIGRHSAEVLIDLAPRFGGRSSSLLDRFALGGLLTMFYCGAAQQFRPRHFIACLLDQSSHANVGNCGNVVQCLKDVRKVDGPPTVTINLGQIAAECYQVGDDLSILVG
jgi:hypothetical protein